MTTGVLTSIRTLNGKFGQFSILTIDGREYTLGKDIAPQMVPSEGSTVSYETRPNKDGTRYYVNKITAVASDPTMTSRETPKATTTTVSRSDSDRQLSMMFSYAKDLVVSGKVEVKVGTPDSIADIIGTTANALMVKFRKMTAPTQEEAPAKGGSF